MKKQLRKLVSILITVALIMCCVSAAFAEGEQNGQTAEKAAITELKLNESIKGILKPETVFRVRLNIKKAETILLSVISEQGNRIKIHIDGAEVKLIRDETDRKLYSCEYETLAEHTYDISLTGDTEASFTLKTARKPETIQQETVIDIETVLQTEVLEIPDPETLQTTDDAEDDEQVNSYDEKVTEVGSEPVEEEKTETLTEEKPEEDQELNEDETAEAETPATEVSDEQDAYVTEEQEEDPEEEATTKEEKPDAEEAITEVQETEDKPEDEAADTETDCDQDDEPESETDAADEPESDDLQADDHDGVEEEHAESSPDDEQAEADTEETESDEKGETIESAEEQNEISDEPDQAEKEYETTESADEPEQVSTGEAEAEIDEGTQDEADAEEIPGDLSDESEDAVQPDEETADEAEELIPERSIIIHNSAEGKETVCVGEEITMTAELVNFTEEDRFICQWQYSEDGGESFKDVEGANELTYSYTVDENNFHYRWQIVVTIQ